MSYIRLDDVGLSQITAVHISLPVTWSLPLAPFSSHRMGVWAAAWPRYSRFLTEAGWLTKWMNRLCQTDRNKRNGPNLSVVDGCCTNAHTRPQKSSQSMWRAVKLVWLLVFSLSQVGVWIYWELLSYWFWVDFPDRRICSQSGWS